MNALFIRLTVAAAITANLHAPNALAMGAPKANEPNSPPATTPTTGRWDHLDPQNVIPDSLLKQALHYFELHESKIKNKNYLTVIDYSQHSSKKRFYLVNLKTGNVEPQLAAHGSGSERKNSGWAPGFSNKDGSHLTSIGYFLTAETYAGKHGYSLKLDGVSPTNSNARARAIVVHPADYVDAKYYPIGRSWGCPALNPKVSRGVIDKIKGGSLIYGYGEN